MAIPFVILLIESLEFMWYHALKALQPGDDLIDQPEILRALSFQNGDNVENNRIFAEAHRLFPPCNVFCFLCLIKDYHICLQK